MIHYKILSAICQQCEYHIQGSWDVQALMSCLRKDLSVLLAIKHHAVYLLKQDQKSIDLALETNKKKQKKKKKREKNKREKKKKE